MKFNIDDYNDSYVMHCPTEEAAIIFLSYLDSIGERWCSGKNYSNSDTRWSRYGSETYYRFTKGSYGCLSWHLTEGLSDAATVLEFDDFDWDDSIDVNEENIAIIEQFLRNFQITS